MKNVNIIKKNHDFQKIINKKNCLRTNQFFIYYLKGTTNFKYGISVGKKLGNAVLRNKIKRQVRMMIQSQLLELKLLKVKIILIVRKNFLEYSFSKTNDSLNQSIKLILEKNGWKNV